MISLAWNVGKFRVEGRLFFWGLHGVAWRLFLLWLLKPGLVLSSLLCTSWPQETPELVPFMPRVPQCHGFALYGKVWVTLVLNAVSPPWEWVGCNLGTCVKQNYRVCFFLALSSWCTLTFFIKAAEFDVGKKGVRTKRAQNTSTPES